MPTGTLNRRLPVDPFAPLLRADRLDRFHYRASRVGLVSSNPRFLTLVVDPSNKCNLRCRMCYFSLDRNFNAPPVFLLPDLFERITAEALPYARTLTLSCGSEPLTSPHFIDILRLASRNRPPHLEFVTNGTLLSPKIAEAVVETGVTDLMVSLDSPRKKTYETIRRGARLDRVLKNLDFLLTARAKAGRALPRLRFNVTLMRSNIEEVEELVTLAADLGVSLLDFRHLLVYEGLGMEQESLFFHQDLSDLWLARAREKARRLGLAFVQCPEPFGAPNGSGKVPAQGLAAWRLRSAGRRFREHPGALLKDAGYRFRDLLRRNLSSAASGERPYCLLPFNYSLINSGGQVYPCPHCSGEGPFGLVSSASPFTAVWLGEGLSELRRNILRNDPPGMCQVCPRRQTAGSNPPDLFRPRET